MYKNGLAGSTFVMPGLVQGIHALAAFSKKDVDGRDKPGHDGGVRDELVGCLRAHAPTHRQPERLVSAADAMRPRGGSTTTVVPRFTRL